LFDAGQAVATPAIWKGKASTVKLGRADALVVAVPTGAAAQIKTQLARPDPLVAPVTKGRPSAASKYSEASNCGLRCLCRPWTL